MVGMNIYTLSHRIPRIFTVCFDHTLSKSSKQSTYIMDNQPQNIYSPNDT